MAGYPPCRATGDQADAQTTKLAEPVAFQHNDSVENRTARGSCCFGGGDGGLGLERARDMQEVEILDGLRGERGKLIALSGAGGL
jgi:hypothetical protein